MADRVVIDVEARFVDNVTNQAKKSQKELDKLSKTKVEPKADTGKLMNKLREAEKKAEKLGKTKTTMVLKAVDKASTTIDKLLNKSKSIAGKTWEAIVKVKDSDAVRNLRRISEQGRGIAGKTWTAVVKIKDMALSPLKKLEESLFSIKSLILAITAGMAAKKFLMMPINLADQYASARIGFQTLLGAERGQQIMNDLDAFAKATPFSTSGVISATQRMIAMGWNAENIIEDMKVIGDAAAATGKGTEGLDRIVLALSQIRSKGKLSTEELNQLAEAGISAKRYIAEGLGFGTGDEGIAGLSKALEGGKIGAEAALGAIMEGMKEYSGMMEATANETVGGLKAQLEDTFEINIFRRWGQGLQSGAKVGLGSVLKLLDTSEKALESIGDLLQETGAILSGKVASAMENTVDRVKKITETEEFAGATYGEKIGMLWEGAIKNPFDNWWRSTVVPWWDETAVPWVTTKGYDIGKEMGKALAHGFIEVTGNIWDNLPGWAKLMVGGYGATKALGGIGLAAKGAGAVRLAIGNTGNAMVGGSGVLGGLASAGYAVSGGAAGSAIGGGTAAAIGAGTIGGMLASAASIITGVADIARGYDDRNLTERQRAALKASGGMKFSGVAAGAMIGTAIAPGVGTAIGAGIGGVAGWLGGSALVKNVNEEALAMDELAQSEYGAKKQAQELARVDMPKHFGEMSLIASEVSTAVNNMIGQDLISRSKEATASITKLEESLKLFDAAESNFGRAVWMTKTLRGGKIAEEQAESLKASAASYTEATATYLKDAQDTSAASIRAIMGSSEAAEKIITKSTEYYDKQNELLKTKTEELNKTMEEALQDGVIGIDEADSLQRIRGQIADIARQIQQDEYQADLNVIKAKYSNPDMSDKTFSEMMQQMNTTAKETTEGYWKTFGKASVGMKEGSDEWNTLMQGTMDQIASVWEAAGDLGISNIQQRWSEELGILGRDFSEIVASTTIPDIVAASENLSAETRSSLSVILDKMQPTTQQIEEIANSYKNAFGVVPKALEEYLNTAEFYEALAKGPKAIEEYFSSRTYNYEVEVGLKPNFHSVSAPFTPTRSFFGIPTELNFGVNVGVKSNTVDTVLRTNKARGGIVGPNGPQGFSAGGMVRGGSQLVRVAEEGSPEMIIPLSSQRRERGTRLWRKAGSMLGIKGFSRGGLTSGGADEGLRFGGYESGGNIGGQTVQVSMGGITVEFNVTASDGNVMNTIREQAPEIAEIVASELYNSFRSQFENTPMRGAV